jgi:Type IV secretion system pilin
MSHSSPRISTPAVPDSSPAPSPAAGPRTARARRAGVLAGVILLALVGAAAPALAATGHTVVLAAPQDLATVITSIRNWLMGILVVVATLFLTLGGVRYVMSDGDPGQVERAKSAIRAAAIGYCLAALAPVIMTVLQSVVGN